MALAWVPCDDSCPLKAASLRIVLDRLDSMARGSMAALEKGNPTFFLLPPIYISEFI